MNHDENNESEKERDSTDSESNLTEVQKCILQNKRLMYKQEQKGFKDVVLETLANQASALESPDKWVNKIKLEKDRLDQVASQDLYQKDIVKYYTEDQTHIPAFRQPAEGRYEEQKAQEYKQSEEYVHPAKLRSSVLGGGWAWNSDAPVPPTMAAQLATKKARMDVINVIEVKMPTDKEKERLRKPDLNRLINRGLAISVNIGEDQEEEVFGHRQDRRFPPANNKLRAKKFNG